MIDKPGYKTTEFYLTLLATGAGLVLAYASPDSTVSKIAGILVALLSSVGYTYSRTILKKDS